MALLEILNSTVLDSHMRRKLEKLAALRCPITWEELDDMGLFAHFDQLPTTEELREFLAEHPV
jgi:hypothetical protein